MPLVRHGVWGSRVAKLRGWIQNGFIKRPVSAAVISIGAFVFSAVVSVWPQEVNQATRRFIVGPNRGAPDRLVAAFWVGVSFWSIILYYRLRSDDRSQAERFDTLAAAIHRAPNPGIFTDYPREFYEEAARAITETMRRGAEDRTEHMERIANGVRSVLAITAVLAARFSRAPLDRAYGANIMLEVLPPFDETLRDTIRFFDHQNNDASSSLFAALRLDPAMLITTTDPDATRTIPVIALPVPKHEVDARGHRIAIPGAPSAFLSGQTSVLSDTRDIARFCDGLPAGVIEAIVEYFGPTGDGRDVRSFASFRIGDAARPIGVLNIDSGDPHLLGPEEYYGTFYALMGPIVRLLRKPVSEYAGYLMAPPRVLP